MYASLLVLSFVASVSAHFQLQYPDPRGPFAEDDEPHFCDGFTNAVSSRELFPLDNGFIVINSEHPTWTLAVLISIEQNPSNFSVFNQSTSGVNLPLAAPFFQENGEGAACIPVDIGSLKIPGVQNGSNITLQVQFDGGDGNLFQCTDLTLSSNFSIPSNVSCTNVVGNATATTTSPGTTNTNTASQPRAGWTGVLGLVFTSALSYL